VEYVRYDRGEWSVDLPSGGGSPRSAPAGTASPPTHNSLRKSYQMRIICIKICLALSNCLVVLTLLFVSVLKILIFVVFSIAK
jgi:hypothetical protein